MVHVLKLDERLNIRVFADLAPELLKNWEHLYARLQNPSFLNHFEWYRCWDAAYGSRNDKKNIFVLIEEAGVPIAILPLAHYRSARFGVVVRRLTLQTDFELKDAIFDERRFTPQVFSESLSALAKLEPYRWDVFDAERIAQDSLAYRLLSDTPWALRHVEQNQVMNRLCRQGDGETAFAIPKGWLKTLKRKQRKLEEQGAIGFEIIAGESAVGSAYASFLQVEGSGWKGEEGRNTSLLQDFRQQKFYRDLLAVGADGFAGSVSLLKLNDVVVAAAINLRVGDTLSLLKIGYNEQYRDFSPGNLLIWKVAEHLAGDEGVAHINFITGLEWHKIWQPETLPVFDMNFYSRTLCGYALLVKARLKPVVQKFSKIFS